MRHSEGRTTPELEPSLRQLELPEDRRSRLIKVIVLATVPSLRRRFARASVALLAWWRFRLSSRLNVRSGLALSSVAMPWSLSKPCRSEDSRFRSTADFRPCVDAC